MGAGFQFVHFGAFSRKGNKSGQTTDFIFGEAERRPDASLHVSNPSPPEIVFGLPISAVRTLHDERASGAKDFMKNGRSRAIRSTQQTLATVIASHPYTVAEARADPSKAAEVAEWERRTLEWLKDQFGSQLVSVVRHTDECHCHLHCYILPENAMMKAAAIHPGHIAKAAVIADGAHPGEDQKTLNKRGDKAYRAAMRDWQDNYHHRVGAPCGLTRIGPQVRRLRRAEWQAEMQAAQTLKKSLARAACVDAKRDDFVKQTKQDASKFLERTRQQALALLADATENAAAIEADAAKVAAHAASARRDALAAQDRARKDQEQARSAMADAVRYASWAGRLRAIWDHLRTSSLIEKVRADFSSEIDRWRAAAQTAEQRQLEAERQRFEAERKAREAQDVAMRAGFERDRLRSLISPSATARETPTSEFTPKPKLVPNPLKFPGET